MNQKTKIKSEQLKNALDRLNEIINIPIGPHRAEIDASIQRFEFCIELFWKSLQEKLYKDHGISIQSPKKAFEQAYINGLITDESIWIDMINDRNATVHTYDEEFANAMYERIKAYTPFLTKQYALCFNNPV